MNICRIFAPALVALAVAAPVQADPAGPLREALAMVPLATGSTEGPAFTDLTVAAEVLAGRDLTGFASFFSGPFGPLSLAQPLGGAPIPDVMSDTDWPRFVGFAMDEIRIVVNYGTPPDAALRLDLEPGVMPRVEAALVANGYERSESDDGPLFRRGDQDYAVSIESRNPGDPFGGMLGQSSRVLVQGDRLTRAAGMPMIEAAMNGPFWDARPDLAALLDVLSDLPLGTRVMRAQVLTDQLMFAPRDFSTDAEEGPAPPGIPFWSLGLLVELVEGKNHDAAALAAFVYGSRDQAEAAVSGIETGWTIESPLWGAAPAERIGPVVLSIEGEGPFIVMARVAGGWTTEGMLRNISFERLFTGYLSGALTVFGPAS